MPAVCRGVGAIVIGEPTNLEVYIAEKGACWLEITTYGKTAHGSMPDLGINAVMHMTAALQALTHLSLPFQPHPLLDKPTMNVGTIAGGQKTNVVPDRCTATIDMRTLPGMRHDDVVQEIRQTLDGLREAIPSFHYELRVIAERAPVASDPRRPSSRPLVHPRSSWPTRKRPRQHQGLPPMPASFNRPAVLLS